MMNMMHRLMIEEEEEKLLIKTETLESNQPI